MTVGWWNEERDDALRRLAKAGRSTTEIAREIGAASRNAVIGRASRIGVNLGEDRSAPRPPSTPGQPKRDSAKSAAWRRDEPILRELIAEGASLSEAAAQLGRTYDSVKRRAWVLGLRTRKAAAPKQPNWNRPPSSTSRAAPTPLRRPVAVADGKPVLFLDRRDGQCCWPLWEPPARTGMVCGAATGSVVESYCAGHHAVAWRKQEAA